MFTKELLGGRFDPAEEFRKIRDFLIKSIEQLNKKGAIFGLSGGLDSTVVCYVCKRALSSQKVFGLLMPERDSNPQNVEVARETAQKLNVHTQEIDLTPLLGEFHFSSFIQPKLRLRMILLYYHAGLKDYAVVGTTNRSEWEVGHYDRYGDGACDIDPIAHLYKTQVKELANYLGVPEKIINKPASPDLIPGITDELTLGMSFEELDPILFLLSQGLPDEEIAREVNCDQKAVREIRKATEEIRKIRELPKRTAGP